MAEAFQALAHWQILLAIGLLLSISEIFIPGFVMLPIGIGFFLTAGLSVFVQNWTILLASLAGFELLIFWVFNTHLKKFHAKTRSYTNAEGMIGSECIVTEAIPTGGIGYVKLYGDSWAAKSAVGGSLEAGARVVIVKLDGNKVWVEPII